MHVCTLRIQHVLKLYKVDRRKQNQMFVQNEYYFMKSKFNRLYLADAKKTITLCFRFVSPRDEVLLSIKLYNVTGNVYYINYEIQIISSPSRQYMKFNKCFCVLGTLPDFDFRCRVVSDFARTIYN